VKWRVTLKWEGLAVYYRLRWVVPVALALWAILMLLSLFVPPGVNWLWVLYLPIMLAGLYTLFGSNFSIAENEWHDTTERLCARPALVLFIARMPYNLASGAMGVGLLYLGNIALQRLQITWFDMLRLLTGADTPDALRPGSMLLLLLFLSILVPAFALSGTVAWRCPRRWRILTVTLWLAQLIIFGVAVSALPADYPHYAPALPLFDGGRVHNPAEAAMLAVLIASPLVNTALAAWLYDNKA